MSKASHPDHYSWLEARKKEILETKKKTYYFSGFKRQMYVTDEHGKKRKVKQTRGVSVSAPIIDPDNGLTTHDMWTYVSNLNSCKNNGDGTYSLNRKTMFIRNNEVFAIPEDLEMIVYLKYMTKNKHVREIDHQAQNKAEAESKALESQVYFYIFNENSPVHPKQTGSEKQLRNLAMAWQVPGADTSDIHGVMNTLWEVVQGSNKNSKAGADGRGYKQFCEDAANLGNSEDRSTIVLAILRGALVFDEDESSWKIKVKGGGERFLCGVPLGKESDKDEYAIKHVLGEEYYLGLVKESLSYVPNPDIDYSKLTRQERIDKCHNELGWPKGKLNSTSDQVLIERLEKKLVPEK